ncbi:MAG TPA: hypothetical protein VFP63_02605 [Dehalococcoidia bacterium]|nr:hypothetical protein [Dehalococcoidia bacterium]
MTTQTDQSSARDSAAAAPHRLRTRVPRSRRITLPRMRTEVHIHPDGRAHPEGISQASGTTTRRALDAPARRRVKI